MRDVTAIESITQDQFDRLPVVLQDIVNYARELGNLRRRPVIDFDEFRRLKACLSEACKGAESRWGCQLHSDGTAPA